MHLYLCYDSSLFRMTEHPKLSGPVQVIAGTLEKGNNLNLIVFSRETEASDFSFFVDVQLDHQHVISLAYKWPECKVTRS